MNKFLLGLLILVGIILSISNVNLSCDQAPLVIDSSYKIYVDFSPYTSVEEASVAEATIDWSQENSQKMIACTESFAAVELKNFLLDIFKESADQQSFKIQKLTNNIPANSIIITDISNPQMQEIIASENLDVNLEIEESFAIIPQNDKIYIIGFDRVGSLYGTYHFLEMIGVRWFAPREIGIYIPKSNRFEFPAKTIKESPKFITRGFWAWEDRGNKEFYLWMARNKLNFWTIAEPDHAFLRKIGIQLTAGGHLHFERYLNPHDEYPFNHQIYKGDEDKPEEPYQTNKGEYKGDQDRNKVLTYFEAHPEWYGLINGQRQTFKGDFGTNICTSNNDVIKELCRKLTDDLADGEWKNINTLNFWPLDVGKWCECELCTQLGTPTDRLLILIHQVRNSISAGMDKGRINRNVKVIFPIYYETLAPPTKPLPDDFDYDNCIGTVFPIRRCYVHFLDDSLCTEYNTEIWQEFLGWVKSEPKYYHGQFFMGEYFNVSSIKSLPVVYTRIMAHDIPLYYHKGVRHCHYMHVYTELFGQKRLNNYLFAKLLWNFDIDESQLLNEYFTKFYENAGMRMKRLYERLEYAMSNIKQVKHKTPLVGRINADETPLFNLQHLQLKESRPPKNDGVDLEESVMALKECRSIMNELLSQKWAENIQQRMLEDDRNLKYAENTIFLYYYVAQAIIAKRESNMKDAMNMYKKSIPFAKALESEKEIVQTSSSHANAKDGLEASLIKDTYLKLGKELKQPFE
jgi:hypothetical protein